MAAVRRLSNVSSEAVLLAAAAAAAEEKPGTPMLVEPFINVEDDISEALERQTSEHVEADAEKLIKTGKLFVLGSVILNSAVGPVLDMFAYSFAAQALIAPFGGLDTVWNLFLAPCMLKEKLTKSRAIAGCVIFGATACTVSVAPQEDRVYTPETIRDILLTWWNLAYFVAFSLWIAVNMLVLQKRPVGDTLRGLSLGMTAGSLGGNMFCVKFTATLLKDCFSPPTGTSTAEAFKEAFGGSYCYMTYIVICGAIFFAVINISFLVKGMKECEALFMVTIFEGSMMCSGALSAGCVLREFAGLEWWKVVIYYGLIGIIILGMVLLFRAEKSVAENDADLESADGPAQPTSKLMTEARPSQAFAPDEAP